MQAIKLNRRPSRARTTL